MKKSNLEYTSQSEANAIICDLHHAELNIIPTHENAFKITCENAKGVHISLNESVLKVKQTTRPSIFLKRKIRLDLYVPDHTVPDIIVDGKNCAVKITEGIYGQFSLSLENGSAEFSDCSFAACSLIGDALSTYLKGITVKNLLVVKCASGDMIWENSFAACTECRVKRGNIGLCGFTCKDSILEAENGNVAARLNGEESDYNLGLLIKEGTANRESVQREGAARSFKAYSAKGNIAIDFMPEDESQAYGDN